MADHAAVLSMAMPDYREFVRKLDGAVRAGGAALAYNRVARSRTIDFFTNEGTEFTDDEFWAAREQATNFDSLMVFAFQGAPDDVVRTWGSDHGEDLGEAAVEKVRVLAESAPSLRAEWDARRAGLGRELGDVRAPVVFSPTTGDLRVLFRLESFEVGGLRLQPITGTEQSAEAVLSRADARRLIDILLDAVVYIDSVEKEAIDAE